jgi:hypothetical protein
LISHRWSERLFGMFVPHFRRSRPSRGRDKLRDADEIISGRSKDEEPFDQLAPPMPGLAQPADGLDPSERLFNPLSDDGADAVSRMAGRAPINRRAAVGIVLGS